jgi:CheY-like chemotaxis protein
VTTLLKKETIFISIQDTGVGISSDKINKVFDPFFTTKPAGKGSGLGLAISNEIMIGLGSEIHVKSNVNKGTTFFMELPLQITLNKNKNIINSENIKNKENKKIKILLVDDEQLMLRSLKRVLDMDYEVISAHGGRAALQALDDLLGKVNIIITDVYMLDINGIDLYRYIAEKYPGLEKSIIFLTGDISHSHQMYFFDSLPNTILYKPVSADNLKKSIDDLLKLPHDTIGN